MNNPKVYQAFSVLGFVVSAVFTVKLFASNSSDIISWLAMIATALLYEFGKYILLYQGIKGPFSEIGRGIMITLWVFVTTASIIASATYVLNDANANRNRAIENSTAYQNQQGAIKVQKDLYEVKKKEIEDLKALQVKQQQEGQAIVNAMPRDYIDRKNQQRVSTQALITNTQSKIDQKSSELSSIAGNIATPLAKIEITEESTTGGDSMFKLIALKLNENPAYKNNPYNAEQVGIFFYISIGIGLEMLANLFAFLSQYYKYGKFSLKSPTPPENKKPLPEIKEKLETSENTKLNIIQSGRLKGFQLKMKDLNNIRQFKPRINKDFRPTTKESSDNTKVSEDDIQKYIMFVTENSKNSIAPGRNKIVHGTGFSQETCRMIHNILIGRGFLETGDKCTKIIGEVG